MKNQFIGYWRLIKWHLTLDNAFYSHPFGADAKGELIYMPNGRMFASLMQANRPHFAKANLSRASTAEQKAAIETYFSYSGTYEIVENKVVHQVEFSLLPNWKGIEVVRYFDFSENGQQLTLTTAVEMTKTGKKVQNHLLWERKN